ncbi:hypothetical protein ACLKA7_012028 [Drosophila subpalustris]
MVPLQFTAELQQGNLQQQEHKISHTQKSQQVAAVARFIKGAREADFKSVASEQPNGIDLPQQQQQQQFLTAHSCPKCAHHPNHEHATCGSRHINAIPILNTRSLASNSKKLSAKYRSPLGQLSCSTGNLWLINSFTIQCQVPPSAARLSKTTSTALSTTRRQGTTTTRPERTMLTRLYNTEEDPAYCSFIWGANLSSNDLVLGTAANVSHIYSNDLRDDLYTDVEDPRTEALREYCYGLMLPIICSLGIMGNVLNLIVLTRRNMRGTAYIYMRVQRTVEELGRKGEAFVRSPIVFWVK